MRLKAYTISLLVGIDQLFNAMAGPLLNYIFGVKAFGNPDETLSSVFGKYRDVCKLCQHVCIFLDWVDPGHCDRSIERDEGRDNYGK